ncbi:MAG: hypothetical protein WB988_00755, partial [Candidatus Nitrosopolaris sp.]
MINRQLVLDILKEDGPKFRHSIAFYSRQKQRCTVGLCLNRFGLMPEESNDTTINSDHWTRSLEKFKNELNCTDNEFKKIIQEMEDSPIPKLLTHSSNSVTKLTDRKIRWIIREK